MKKFKCLILALFIICGCNGADLVKRVSVRTITGRIDTVCVPVRCEIFNYGDACYEIVSLNGVDFGVPLMLIDGELCRMDTLSLNVRNYKAVCEAYGIRDPEKVYAQSRLESGNFTSRNYLKKNNHLGISGGDGYKSFDYWADCLRDYAGRIAYKRGENEGFYEFIARIGYAQDPLYVSKVKKMVSATKEEWEEGNIDIIEF